MVNNYSECHVKTVLKYGRFSLKFSDEIKFHDPNDFAERDNLQQPQPNIHQQQINEQNLNQANKAPAAKIKLGDGGKAHAPHPHQAHGHGIGESVDAE